LAKLSNSRTDRLHGTAIFWLYPQLHTPDIFTQFFAYFLGKPTNDFEAIPFPDKLRWLPVLIGHAAFFITYL